jgi:hypothetical protein
MSRYPDERSERGVLVRRRERGVKEGPLSAECIFIVLAPTLFPFLPGIRRLAFPHASCSFSVHIIPHRRITLVYRSLEAMRIPSPQITVLQWRGSRSAGLPPAMPRCDSGLHLDGNLHIHPRRTRSCAGSMNHTRRVWRFVWTDTVVGADVGEYSALFPALVRPSMLPSITPTFSFHFLLSLRVHLGNVLLLANVFPALRCC